MWASWAVHVSLGLQLPSFRHTRWQRGPVHPLWATWGLTCSNGSSHRQPPLPQEAPVLLPCLIMWARCLGVSLCHPVALSASIMPLSGRQSYCGTQFVSVCICLSVCGWLPHPHYSFSPPAEFFSYYSKKKKAEKGEATSIQSAFA